jgi:hypothetical protein
VAEKSAAQERSVAREKMHRREGVSILLGGRAPIQFACPVGEYCMLLQCRSNIHSAYACPYRCSVGVSLRACLSLAEQ